MTREEQLRFCSVCNHRKMDMQQGLLCELTNAKADFDGNCPNYDEDVTKKEKSERIEKEFQETLTVSGWLAFFLWVGVGLGAMFSCLFIIPILVDLGFTFAMLLASLSVVCLMITAILTIKAFYQKAPNAVALAKTYIAMIAIDGILSIVIYVLLSDSALLMQAVRSLIWAAIWLSYILLSTRVENMIPISIRKWNTTEKVLIVLYTLPYVYLVVKLALLCIL